MTTPFVSQYCKGERCFCGEVAEHKVEETVFDDEPNPMRHPLTSYVCHAHFREIMGPAAERRTMIASVKDNVVEEKARLKRLDEKIRRSKA
jgi:hypothetical protein